MVASDRSGAGEEKLPVTLQIDLAPRADGSGPTAVPRSAAALPSATRKEALPGSSAFTVTLQSAATTRAAAVYPDQLYNLEIVQYDSHGAYKARAYFSGATPAGSYLEADLQTLADCQLVVVAWGEGNTTTLGTKSLEDARKVTIDPSLIQDLDPASSADMNKMPYVLHLRHVKITSDGTRGTIGSIDGESADVRLRLQRLATRLTFHWDYSVADYSLGQILLHSIPFDYNVVATPDPSAGNTYPSLLDQFTTVRISDTQIAASGTYACWVPANVRGVNPAATLPVYRTKTNAPIGSAYISFLAVKNGEANKKQKLDYRIYLGGKETSDFNLYPNTDYTYMATFTHTGLPTNDARVTIIDPVPASENNNNFVATGNCLMVVPGGAFCFNPYAYYVKGAVGENELLQSWCQEARIKSVKVLWQTKENGDVGDPVLGVASSAEDHTNIVELKNGEDFARARIYCRVASNTTGGSGVIAAYDDAEGKGNILWSWHIWVTGYTPSATADETVLDPASKRVLQLSRNGTSYHPMMDRCLGAYEGYVAVPSQVVDMSRANGFHYQKGRKDPFPGSYPSGEMPNIYSFVINPARPPRNCLNRYKADGVTWLIPTGLNMTSLQYTYQHPEAMGNANGQEWCFFSPLPTWSTAKTVHDPCPAGWRVPTSEELQILIDYNKPNQTAVLANSKADGGVLMQYDATANRTYMRFSGYPAIVTQLNNIGFSIILTTVSSNSKSNLSFVTARSGGIVDASGGIYFFKKDNHDANNVRCIQDR